MTQHDWRIHAAIACGTVTVPIEAASMIGKLENGFR
jgi:hypothetical protein